MDTLGQRIQKRRKQLKWSQEELEFASKLSRNEISNIERDQAIPSIKSLCQLANALKVPFYHLMPNDCLEILADNSAEIAYRELCAMLNTKNRVQAVKTIINATSVYHSPE